jgi:hypothetical protein
MSYSLAITDLPYLELTATRQLAGQLTGGEADSSAATHAGPGVAVAAATATANGQIARTLTRTDARVQQNSYFSMSRAIAFGAAVSYDGKNVQRDVSFSISFYFGPT